MLFNLEVLKLGHWKWNAVLRRVCT